jgi:hypothetical protein
MLNLDGKGWSTPQGGVQQNIPGVGTSGRPSLAVYQDRLYIAWKGAGNDQGIYWSSFDGRTWAPQRNIGGVGTGSSVGPSLAVHQNRLYIAWKGASNDTGIYWSMLNLDGTAWSTPQGGVQQNIPGVGSSVGPSLMDFQGRLYAAWKGAGDNTGIWWSMLNLDGKGWSTQQNIPGVGSSVGPSLAVYQNRLFAAWRGAGDNQGLWWSSFDGQSPWAPQQNISGVGSSVGPSLAVFQDKLYAAWRGANDNQAIWWSSASPPPPTTTQRPPPPSCTVQTTGDQTAILNAQNGYRNTCGAPALCWDAALAANAQAWANGCHQDKSGKFCHQSDTTNCPGAAGNVNGENITFSNRWTQSAGGPQVSVLPAWTPVEAVKSWYCEARRYPFDRRTPFIIFGATDSNCQGATAHFTQIVWKSTLRVGCASATCPVGPGNPLKGTLWVCEYAPAGNTNTPEQLWANVSSTCPRQE